jgi:hypothetical protein
MVQTLREIRFTTHIITTNYSLFHHSANSTFLHFPK